MFRILENIKLEISILNLQHLFQMTLITCNTKSLITEKSLITKVSLGRGLIVVATMDV